jgi:hypothetical protein
MGIDTVSVIKVRYCDKQEPGVVNSSNAPPSQCAAPRLGRIEKCIGKIRQRVGLTSGVCGIALQCDGECEVFRVSCASMTALAPLASLNCPSLCSDNIRSSTARFPRVASVQGHLENDDGRYREIGCHIAPMRYPSPCADQSTHVQRSAPNQPGFPMGGPIEVLPSRHRLDRP